MLSYNSVSSYYVVDNNLISEDDLTFNRTISNNYDMTDNNNNYYGDIVITNGSVGGLIGKIDKDCFISSSYSKVNITFGNNIYVGGLIGEATGLVSVYNTTVDEIKALMYNNKNLAKQRDLLLPRIMSGQLEV